MPMAEMAVTQLNSRAVMTNGLHGPGVFAAIVRLVKHGLGLIGARIASPLFVDSPATGFASCVSWTSCGPSSGLLPGLRIANHMAARESRGAAGLFS